MSSYVAACAIYRDDADYLAEWIEFHRLVGFERFFLYDNRSTDHHRDVLAPYLADGTAVVHDWPVPFLSYRGRVSGQTRAFEDCVVQHRGDARWIAFLDIDEFLFSPTGYPVSDILPDYEARPGVGVGRVDFGTSGHVRRPDGLVIESFLHRRALRADAQGPIKSIVDPKRVARCLGAHHFVYRDGFAVDERLRPIDGPDRNGRTPVSVERLRVNHYWTKSEEEFLGKLGLWSGQGHTRAQPNFSAVRGRFRVPDETITTYAPALREALGEVAG